MRHALSILGILLSGLLADVTASPVTSILGAKSTSIADTDDQIVAVQYLESTGTQWIDTGVVLNTDPSTVEIRGTTFIAGCQYSTSNTADWNHIQVVSNSVTLYVFGYTAKITYAGTFGDWHTFLCVFGRKSGQSQGLWIDGEQVAYKYSTWARDPITSRRLHYPIFCCYDGYYRSRTYSRGKISEVTITKEGKVVCHLMPVRIGRVGYMLDTITGDLLGNSGTGNFLIGPDL